MHVLKMCQRIIILLLVVSASYSQSFDFKNLKSYAKIFNLRSLYFNETGNTLWHGLFKDCAKKATFSCIQKNVYTYLDETFADSDNITVFDGLLLTKNNLDYHKYSAKYNERSNAEEQGHVDETHSDGGAESTKERVDEEGNSGTTNEETRNIEDNYVEPLTPLEEVTNALHDKAIKFLSTRDYELQLPSFFFEGTSIKISPKEVDDDGALIRVDFKQRELTTEGRFFKKIKKFIKNKLITSLLALVLIIKLIKIKFFFIIPFLFGVGTAKKLFLKLLLFLIPAFAHVFKLCSSYYSGTKYHHHHHQIAHHHHHVPVPVPIPSYHEHHPHHYESDDFSGYDYTPPHIQYRKDVEELKEWGIEPYEDVGFASYGPYAHVEPATGPYGMPQYAANARPVAVVPNHLGPYEKYPPQTKYDKPYGRYDNSNHNVRYTTNGVAVGQKNGGPKSTASNLGPIGNHGQSLAYNGYLDDGRFTRAATTITEATPAIGPYPPPQQQHSYSSQIRPAPVYVQKSEKSDQWLSGSTNTQPSIVSQGYGQNVGQKPFQHSGNALPNSQITSSSNLHKSGYNHRAPVQNIQKKIGGPEEGLSSTVQADSSNNHVTTYDDEYYGPILVRLEAIFRQLRFVDEGCRERLICSMYKNPAIYTPHSNLVSNELSREPEELRKGNRESSSGRRFQRYVNAARLGQDGGDCQRLYSCNLSTS